MFPKGKVKKVLTPNFIEARIHTDLPDSHPHAKFNARIEEVRAKFLEATAPFSRALTAQALVGPASDEALRVSRETLRIAHREVESLFGPELGHLSAPDRAEALEAISASLSPLQWGHLRRSRGNSVARARGVVKRTLVSILRDAGVDV